MAALAAGLGACRKDEVKPAATKHPRLRKPLRVECTTPIIAEMVARVGGDAVDARSLLERDAKPAWRRTGEVEARLLTADAVVALGLRFDEALQASFTRAEEAKIPVIFLGELLPEDQLIPHATDPKVADPHIWLHPTLWSLTSEPLVSALSRLAPGHAEDIEKRGYAVRFEDKQFTAELARSAEFLTGLKRQVTTRNAGLRYLGAAVGLDVQLGDPTSTEPNAVRLETLELGNLKPPGEKMVIRTQSLDLGTTHGLCRMALDLIIEANS